MKCDTSGRSIECRHDCASKGKICNPESGVCVGPSKSIAKKLLKKSTEKCKLSVSTFDEEKVEECIRSTIMNMDSKEITTSTVKTLLRKCEEKLDLPGKSLKKT